MLVPLDLFLSSAFSVLEKVQTMEPKEMRKENNLQKVQNTLKN